MVFCHPNLTYDTFLESLGPGQYSGIIMITMMMIRNIKKKLEGMGAYGPLLLAPQEGI